MGLRVLLTTYDLRRRRGLEMYVADVARELRRQGHSPVVFALHRGDVGDQLVGEGIDVSTALDDVAAPDIIHGNGDSLTLSALESFVGTPAIVAFHNHQQFENAPVHPRIVRYVAPSRVCIERLVRDGISRDRTQLSLNSVDTARFTPRNPLPVRPTRAVAFSNYAHPTTQLPAITEACAKLGIALDVVGAGADRSTSHPEQILGQYDLVFAKAKAALEAMAVGCAVVLCDFAGVGSMVSTGNFDTLRPMNFGFEALRNPLTADSLVAEVQRYNARDAAAVSARVRAEATLSAAVAGLVDVYRGAIAEHASGKHPNASQRPKRFREVVLFSALRAGYATPRAVKALLVHVPGVAAAWQLIVRHLTLWYRA